MASNPGEWYEEQRVAAERLRHEVDGARRVLRVLEEVDRERGGTVAMLEAASTVVRRLQRQYEQACYVGD